MPIAITVTPMIWLRHRPVGQGRGTLVRDDGQNARRSLGPGGVDPRDRPDRDGGMHQGRMDQPR
jgi:hypothetical protein